MRGRRRSRLWGLLVTLGVLFACNGSDESPTALPPPPAPVVNLQNAIEALFLGAGPITASGACNGGTNWQAYPRGSRLRLIVSTTVTPAQRSTIASLGSEIPALTRGWFTVEVSSTTEPNPRPQSLEVTSTNVSQAEIDASCRPGAGGCVLYGFLAPSVLNAARMLNLNRFDGSGHAHELGHALLGLCHLDGNLVPGSLMGNPHGSAIDRWSTLERQAIQAVYGAGLAPGATREEFVRAGLVAPLAPSVGAPLGTRLEGTSGDEGREGRVLPSRGATRRHGAPSSSPKMPPRMFLR